MGDTRTKKPILTLKPKPAKCAHDYHTVGRAGHMVVVRECCHCGDQYEKDVS